MALIANVLTGGVNNHPTTSEEMNGIYTDFVSQGVVGVVGNTVGVSPATGSFAVNAQGSPDMTVAVTAGVLYATATPASQNSQRFRIKNTVATNVTISANSSGSTKYDWIYVKLDPTNLNTPNVAGDNAASFFTSRSSSLTSDDGTPPTYGYCIAVVTVSNGAATITNGNITDKRVQVTLATGSSSSVVGTDGWATLNATLSNITYLGNRSYSATTSSDQSATLSPNMRIRTTRTVAGPVQCTSLNGSTQYFSKTSPAGMTFTDDFAASAWVKLTSYAAGGIISRYNGTSGWEFHITATGQVRLQGNNAGGANTSYVESYQSLPLNKWVHVAAQLDMSAFTATTTTSYIMIDGLDAPSLVNRAGTNPTALVQAGDLQVGAYNGGSFFAGKIAQAAVFNAKVTQATMRTYASQGFLGTETSLISAYSFNNSISDINTTNANNLTANGSAVATNTDSFCGTQAGGTISSTLDYAVLTAVGTSTINFQVPEGCTVPTSGGVSSVAYASSTAPYGFPRQADKWTISTIYLTTLTHTSGASATVYNIAGANLNIPVGSWNLAGAIQYTTQSAGTIHDVTASLSTSTSTVTDIELSDRLYLYQAATATLVPTFILSKQLTLTAATPYYLLYTSQQALSSNPSISGSISTSIPQITKITATLQI